MDPYPRVSTLLFKPNFVLPTLTPFFYFFFFFFLGGGGGGGGGGGYPRPKFRFFAKAPSPSCPRPYFAKSFLLYCDFLNFPLSESWLCTMSRGQTDYPWFMHQRLGVLLMAPIALIFHIIHLNSTCWQSPSRKIKSNNMNCMGIQGARASEAMVFKFFPLKILG